MLETDEMKGTSTNLKCLTTRLALNRFWPPDSSTKASINRPVAMALCPDILAEHDFVENT